MKSVEVVEQIGAESWKSSSTNWFFFLPSSFFPPLLSSALLLAQLTKEWETSSSTSSSSSFSSFSPPSFADLPSAAQAERQKQLPLIKMVKIFRPPHVFKRSRSVSKTACFVLSVYDDWMSHLAWLRQEEMRRHFLMQRHFGYDYAMKHQPAMQHEYGVERCFQDNSSGSNVSEGSEVEEEKSDDDEDEEPVRFTDLPLREEQEVFGDLRHFVQRQAQRAEMEKVYGQRYEVPDAFDQAQEDRSFAPVAFDEAPPMTPMLAAQAPCGIQY